MKKKINFRLEREADEEKLNCGAIAIYNFLAGLGCAKGLGVDAIHRQIKCPGGASVENILKYLFKKNMCASVIYNPSWEDVKKASKHSYPIVNVRVRSRNYHFVNVVKIDERFIYLSNLWDPGAQRVVDNYKMPKAEFKHRVGFLVGLINVNSSLY